MTTALLSIEKLTSAITCTFPAYFVVSTAPINVEDRATRDDSNPQQCIDEISDYLKKYKNNAEILIVIHGYNTSKTNVKRWFESIYEHIEKHCESRSKGFILIGYRWPSEQIIPSEPENRGGTSGKWGYLRDKWKAAKTALPVTLGKISFWGTIGLVAGTITLIAGVVTLVLKASSATVFLVLSSTLIILSLIAVSPIATILLLRLAGYFRDNYRANNFGVPDLVELIRQIDYALTQDASKEKKEEDWDKTRIKLSFIGHSMGGFVVTNAVRILSDVFAPKSVGTLDARNPEKDPSRDIGNVFSLGRLVLVSPDIPAEAIISGRANFLQSSLRRFEEAYLFSNEGDMALRLASTAANYFSYPARTQDGGYRLGNVTVRTSTNGNTVSQENYGMIVRFPNGLLVRLQDGKLYTLLDGQIVRVEGGQLVKVENQRIIHVEDGQLPSLLDSQIVQTQDGQLLQVKQGQLEPLDKQYEKQDKQPLLLQNGQTMAAIWRFPLDYLFIREKTPLSRRQGEIALAPTEKPIGEFFTFFDCTDYREPSLDEHGKKILDNNGKERSIGIVSHALNKQALTFQDYVSLTIDYFSGKIDTHGGYFSNGERDLKKGLKPEAAFTKLAIYGLACLGFERFLLDLKKEDLFIDAHAASFQQILANLGSSPLTPIQKERIALSQILSTICQEKGIQVMLSQERYTQDVLKE